MKKYFQQMNRRERMLAAMVAAVVIVLVNLFLWSWLRDGIRDASAEVDKRKAVRQEQTIFLREGDLWSKRDAWLRQHQPVFKSAADASGLLEQTKQVAAKYKVLLENPAIGTGDSNAAYQSIFVSVETKSPWEPLVHFLYDMQQPESFVVCENVNLAIDPSDATQMRGKFRIARWCAPLAGAKLGK
ncbi:MAG: hypothetical protein M3R59_01515 [Verrucomicrobiota bacterium]|nr:hypothetical protein [Verrucomicrobiota bacterium]